MSVRDMIETEREREREGGKKRNGIWIEKREQDVCWNVQKRIIKNNIK